MALIIWLLSSTISTSSNKFMTKRSKTNRRKLSLKRTKLQMPLLMPLPTYLRP
jgi:hypothetical protein